MRRTFSLVVLAALLAASCSYESSGTTTTSFATPEDAPPALGPADVVLSEQRVDGSFFVVDLASMPADGWVVARIDEAGAPGEVIGISELLTIGVIERVAVPFFVPISEDTVVHVTIHIDMNRDRQFTYQPPSDFIDEIGLRADGEAATARATIEILPPLTPTEVFAEGQTTDGTVVGGIDVALPAPGFVVAHADDNGSLGPVLGVSDLLAVGETNDLEIDLEPTLGFPQVVHIAVYIDRNGDGQFGPGEDADEIGVRADGALAVVAVTVTAPTRAPASIEVSNQSSDGDTVETGVLELPFNGFVEVLRDDDGEPGTRIGVSDLLETGTHEDVEIELSTSLSVTTTLWLRLWVDLDGDGELSAGDAIALTTQGGEPAQFRFILTVN